MKTEIDLDPEAYEKARALAAERGQSLGEMIGEAILRFSPEEVRKAVFGVDDEGWPTIHLERPITSEEIKAMIVEDEEWEITRGNPYHPWYLADPDRAARFPEGYPRVVDGPLGLPEVQLGPPGAETPAKVEGTT